MVEKMAIQALIVLLGHFHVFAEVAPEDYITSSYLHFESYEACEDFLHKKRIVLTTEWEEKFPDIKLLSLTCREIINDGTSVPRQA